MHFYSPRFSFLPTSKLFLINFKIKLNLTRSSKCNRNSNILQINHSLLPSQFFSHPFSKNCTFQGILLIINTILNLSGISIAFIWISYVIQSSNQRSSWLSSQASYFYTHCQIFSTLSSFKSQAILLNFNNTTFIHVNSTNLNK